MTLKQNKKLISKLSKYIESNTTSISGFKQQLEFSEDRIIYGKRRLPQLIKELRDIKKGMPEWEDNVRVANLSLITHLEKRGNQLVRLNLLLKKQKILSKLKKLEKE